MQVFVYNGEQSSVTAKCTDQLVLVNRSAKLERFASRRLCQHIFDALQRGATTKRTH